jgi:hypothetical protein
MSYARRIIHLRDGVITKDEAINGGDAGTAGTAGPAAGAGTAGGSAARAGRASGNSDTAKGGGAPPQSASDSEGTA